MKNKIKMITLLGLVMLATGCENKESNRSEQNVTNETTAETNLASSEVDDNYISDTVISWLGQDDLHPLIVSIFPKEDSSCPANFHEMHFEQGIACARIKDGFEYRINNVIHGELLNSETEIVD